MTPGEERVEQLVRLTGRLTDLLAKETAAFEAHRPHEAAPTTGETARLANIYRHEAARIKADPGLIADAPPEARRGLMLTTQTFEAALTRHGRAVAAAKEVTEGLVQAIAAEVASVRDARTPYTANARAPASDASAIALNRRA